LESSRPDGKMDAPEDVAAIRYAQENMGDYKLKSSPDYIVPESKVWLNP